MDLRTGSIFCKRIEMSLPSAYLQGASFVSLTSARHGGDHPKWIPYGGALKPEGDGAN
jgi:hypothetical protein